MSKRYTSIVILILLSCVGCVWEDPAATSSPKETTSLASTSENQVAISPSDNVSRITIDDLLQKIEAREDIIIVDTRSDVEEKFNDDHIKGAIPLHVSRIEANLWVPDDINKEVILY